MKEKIFIRSYRLVPEIRNPLIKSSLIVLLGTGLRMVGPWSVSYTHLTLPTILLV